MEFQWIKSSIGQPGITIQSNNITLNTAAIKYVENFRYCLLGVDNNSGYLAIKPVDKSDVDKGIYEHGQLNKISLGKGYARISNKMCIEEISKITGHEPTGGKFDATYDEKEQMLLINLKGEI